jgi:hypothetical protein
MIFDIHFGDGTTIRAEGKTFHCACIIAQAQRVMYDETKEDQLAVLRGTLVQKPETGSLKFETPRPPDAATGGS